MCPRGSRPHSGVDLNLLLATAARSASLPQSYSTTFTPFSQCSAWLPRTTIFDWLNCPSGASRLPVGGNTSYSDPLASLFSTPGSSMHWYSGPKANPSPFFSCTRYLTPLLPLGLGTRHSKLSSKFSKVSVVTRSFGLALLCSSPTQWRHPSSITQRSFGNPSIPSPRQPAVVAPSNKSRQPACFSTSVSEGRVDGCGGASAAIIVARARPVSIIAAKRRVMRVLQSQSERQKC